MYLVTGNIFFSAVLMAEVVKLWTCLIIVYAEKGGIVNLFETLDKQVVKQPMDTLKVCVPSFVYLVQNNLLYVSASHLDAATYQVRSVLLLFRCVKENLIKLLIKELEIYGMQKTNI